MPGDEENLSIYESLGVDATVSMQTVLRMLTALAQHVDDLNATLPEGTEQLDFVTVVLTRGEEPICAFNLSLREDNEEPNLANAEARTLVLPVEPLIVPTTPKEVN